MYIINKDKCVKDGLKCSDVSCGPHLVVDGDTIGPTDAHIDQDQPLGAIQPRALNTRVLTPLSPEQIPAHRDTHKMI